MSRNEIAVSRKISRRNVNEVISIVANLNISYDDIKDKTDDYVYKLVYPNKYRHLDENFYAKPDYLLVHSELKRVGVNLRLLWMEYSDKARAQCGIPVKYTKFCEDCHDCLAAHLLPAYSA